MSGGNSAIETQLAQYEQRAVGLHIGVNSLALSNECRKQEELLNEILQLERQLGGKYQQGGNDVYERASDLKEEAEGNVMALKYLEKISDLERVFKLLVEQVSGTSVQLSDKKALSESVHINKDIGSNVQSCWAYVAHLARISQVHLRDAANYQMFYHTVNEVDTHLDKRTSESNQMRQPTYDQRMASILSEEMSNLLKHFVHLWDQTGQLLDESTHIVPVGLRLGGISRQGALTGNRRGSSSVNAKALLSISGPNYSIQDGESVTVLDNSTDQAFWTVRTSGGEDVQFPSVCLWLSDPDLQAIDDARRLREKCTKCWKTVIERLKARCADYYEGLLQELGAGKTIRYNSQNEMDKLLDDIENLYPTSSPTGQRLRQSVAQFRQRLQLDSSGGGGYRQQGYAGGDDDDSGIWLHAQDISRLNNPLHRVSDHQRQMNSLTGSPMNIDLTDIEKDRQRVEQEMASINRLQQDNQSQLESLIHRVGRWSSRYRRRPEYNFDIRNPIAQDDWQQQYDIQPQRLDASYATVPSTDHGSMMETVCQVGPFTQTNQSQTSHQQLDQYYTDNIQPSQGAHVFASRPPSDQMIDSSVLMLGDEGLSPSNSSRRADQEAVVQVGVVTKDACSDTSDFGWQRRDSMLSSAVTSKGRVCDIQTQAGQVHRDEGIQCDQYAPIPVVETRPSMAVKSAVPAPILSAGAELRQQAKPAPLDVECQSGILTNVGSTQCSVTVPKLPQLMDGAVQSIPAPEPIVATQPNMAVQSAPPAPMVSSGATHHVAPKAAAIDVECQSGILTNVGSTQCSVTVPKLPQLMDGAVQSIPAPEPIVATQPNMAVQSAPPAPMVSSGATHHVAPKAAAIDVECQSGILTNVGSTQCNQVVPKLPQLMDGAVQSIPAPEPIVATQPNMAVQSAPPAPMVSSGATHHVAPKAAAIDVECQSGILTNVGSTQCSVTVPKLPQLMDGAVQSIPAPEPIVATQPNMAVQSAPPAPMVSSGASHYQAPKAAAIDVECQSGILTNVGSTQCNQVVPKLPQLMDGAVQSIPAPEPIVATQPNMAVQSAPPAPMVSSGATHHVAPKAAAIDVECQSGILTNVGSTQCSVTVPKLPQLMDGAVQSIPAPEPIVATQPNMAVQSAPPAPMVSSGATHHVAPKAAAIDVECQSGILTNVGSTQCNQVVPKLPQLMDGAVQSIPAPEPIVATQPNMAVQSAPPAPMVSSGATHHVAPKAAAIDVECQSGILTNVGSTQCSVTVPKLPQLMDGAVQSIPAPEPIVATQPNMAVQSAPPAPMVSSGATHHVAPKAAAIDVECQSGILTNVGSTQCNQVVPKLPQLMDGAVQSIPAPEPIVATQPNMAVQSAPPAPMVSSGATHHVAPKAAAIDVECQSGILTNVGSTQCSVTVPKLPQLMDGAVQSIPAPEPIVATQPNMAVQSAPPAPMVSSGASHYQAPKAAAIDVECQSGILTNVGSTQCSAAKMTMPPTLDAQASYIPPVEPIVQTQAAVAVRSAPPAPMVSSGASHYQPKVSMRDAECLSGVVTTVVGTQCSQPKAQLPATQEASVQYIPPPKPKIPAIDVECQSGILTNVGSTQCSAAKMTMPPTLDAQASYIPPVEPIVQTQAAVAVRSAPPAPMVSSGASHYQAPKAAAIDVECQSGILTNVGSTQCSAAKMTMPPTLDAQASYIPPVEPIVQTQAAVAVRSAPPAPMVSSGASHYQPKVSMRDAECLSGVVTTVVGTQCSQPKAQLPATQEASVQYIPPPKPKIPAIDVECQSGILTNVGSTQCSAAKMTMPPTLDAQASYIPPVEPIVQTQAAVAVRSAPPAPMVSSGASHYQPKVSMRDAECLSGVVTTVVGTQCSQPKAQLPATQEASVQYIPPPKPKIPAIDVECQSGILTNVGSTQCSAAKMTMPPTLDAQASYIPPVEPIVKTQAAVAVRSAPPAPMVSSGASHYQAPKAAAIDVECQSGILTNVGSTQCSAAKMTMPPTLDAQASYIPPVEPIVQTQAAVAVRSAPPAPMVSSGASHYQPKVSMRDAECLSGVVTTVVGTQCSQPKAQLPATQEASVQYIPPPKPKIPAIDVECQSGILTNVGSTQCSAAKMTMPPTLDAQASYIPPVEPIVQTQAAVAVRSAPPAPMVSSGASHYQPKVSMRDAECLSGVVTTVVGTQCSQPKAQLPATQEASVQYIPPPKPKIPAIDVECQSGILTNVGSTQCSAAKMTMPPTLDAQASYIPPVEPIVQTQAAVAVRSAPPAPMVSSGASHYQPKVSMRDAECLSGVVTTVVGTQCSQPKAQLPATQEASVQYIPPPKPKIPAIDVECQSGILTNVGSTQCSAAKMTMPPTLDAQASYIPPVEPIVQTQAAVAVRSAPPAPMVSSGASHYQPKVSMRDAECLSGVVTTVVGTQCSQPKAQLPATQEASVQYIPPPKPKIPAIDVECQSGILTNVGSTQCSAAKMTMPPTLDAQASYIPPVEPIVQTQAAVAVRSAPPAPMVSSGASHYQPKVSMRDAECLSGVVTTVVGTQCSQPKAQLPATQEASVQYIPPPKPKIPAIDVECQSGILTNVGSTQCSAAKMTMPPTLDAQASYIPPVEPIVQTQAAVAVRSAPPAPMVSSGASHYQPKVSMRDAECLSGVVTTVVGTQCSQPKAQLPATQEASVQYIPPAEPIVQTQAAVAVRSAPPAPMVSSGASHYQPKVSMRDAECLSGVVTTVVGTQCSQPKAQLPATQEASVQYIPPVEPIVQTQAAVAVRSAPPAPMVSSGASHYQAPKAAAIDVECQSGILTNVGSTQCSAAKMTMPPTLDAQASYIPPVEPIVQTQAAVAVRSAPPAPMVSSGASHYQPKVSMRDAECLSGVVTTVVGTQCSQPKAQLPATQEASVQYIPPPKPKIPAIDVECQSGILTNVGSTQCSAAKMTMPPTLDAQASYIPPVEPIVQTQAAVAVRSAPPAPMVSSGASHYQPKVSMRDAECLSGVVTTVVGTQCSQPKAQLPATQEASVQYIPPAEPIVQTQTAVAVRSAPPAPMVSSGASHYQPKVSMRDAECLSGVVTTVVGTQCSQPKAQLPATQEASVQYIPPAEPIVQTQAAVAVRSAPPAPMVSSGASHYQPKVSMRDAECLSGVVTTVVGTQCSQPKAQLPATQEASVQYIPPPKPKIPAIDVECQSGILTNVGSTQCSAAKMTMPPTLDAQASYIPPVEPIVQTQAAVAVRSAPPAPMVSSGASHYQPKVSMRDAECLSGVVTTVVGTQCSQPKAQLPATQEASVQYIPPPKPKIPAIDVECQSGILTNVGSTQCSAAKMTMPPTLDAQASYIPPVEPIVQTQAAVAVRSAPPAPMVSSGASHYQPKVSMRDAECLSGVVTTVVGTQCSQPKAQLPATQEASVQYIPPAEPIVQTQAAVAVRSAPPAPMVSSGASHYQPKVSMRDAECLSGVVTTVVGTQCSQPKAQLPATQEASVQYIPSSTCPAMPLTRDASVHFVPPCQPVAPIQTTLKSDATTQCIQPSYRLPDQLESSVQYQATDQVTTVQLPTQNVEPLRPVKGIPKKLQVGSTRPLQTSSVQFTTPTDQDYKRERKVIDASCQSGVLTDSVHSQTFATPLIHSVQGIAKKLQVGQSAISKSTTDPVLVHYTTSVCSEPPITITSSSNYCLDQKTSTTDRTTPSPLTTVTSASRADLECQSGTITTEKSSQYETSPQVSPLVVESQTYCLATSPPPVTQHREQKPKKFQVDCIPRTPIVISQTSQDLSSRMMIQPTSQPTQSDAPPITQRNTVQCQTSVIRKDGGVNVKPTQMCQQSSSFEMPSTRSTTTSRTATTNSKDSWYQADLLARPTSQMRQPKTNNRGIQNTPQSLTGVTQTMDMSASSLSALPIVDKEVKSSGTQTLDDHTGAMMKRVVTTIRPPSWINSGPGKSYITRRSIPYGHPTVITRSLPSALNVAEQSTTEVMTHQINRREKIDWDHIIRDGNELPRRDSQSVDRINRRMSLKPRLTSARTQYTPSGSLTHVTVPMVSEQTQTTEPWVPVKRPAHKHKRIQRGQPSIFGPQQASYASGVSVVTQSAQSPLEEMQQESYQRYQQHHHQRESTIGTGPLVCSNCGAIDSLTHSSRVTSAYQSQSVPIRQLSDQTTQTQSKSAELELSTSLPVYLPDEQVLNLSPNQAFLGEPNLESISWLPGKKTTTTTTKADSSSTDQVWLTNPGRLVELRMHSVRAPGSTNNRRIGPLEAFYRGILRLVYCDEAGGKPAVPILDAVRQGDIDLIEFEIDSTIQHQQASTTTTSSTSTNMLAAKVVWEGGKIQTTKYSVKSIRASIGQPDLDVENALKLGVIDKQTGMLLVDRFDDQPGSQRVIQEQLTVAEAICHGVLSVNLIEPPWTGQTYHGIAHSSGDVEI